jgi:NADH-quinone oxidoreductase subunit F
MRYDPHQMIEGMIISAYALRSNTSYIYIRGEYWYIKEILEKALAQAYAKGFSGQEHFRLRLRSRYVCAPRRGRLHLRRRDGVARIARRQARAIHVLKPPFPGSRRLVRWPDSGQQRRDAWPSVPWIILNGGEWYKALGTEKSGGTKLYTVSGHIIKPGNYEVPMGYPLMSLINNECGGMKGGKKLKACIPGRFFGADFERGRVREDDARLRICRLARHDARFGRRDRDGRDR